MTLGEVLELLNEEAARLYFVSKRKITRNFSTNSMEHLVTFIAQIKTRQLPQLENITEVRAYGPYGILYFNYNILIQFQVSTNAIAENLYAYVQALFISENVGVEKLLAKEELNNTVTEELTTLINHVNNTIII